MAVGENKSAMRSGKFHWQSVFVYNARGSKFMYRYTFNTNVQRENNNYHNILFKKQQQITFARYSYISIAI